MPRTMDAHKLLDETWPEFCDVEETIQKAFDCRFQRDLLPNLHGAVALHGQHDPAPFNDSVVVMPIMQFHTRQQLEQYLSEAAKPLIRELKQVKPKALGSLWVACFVNPGRMCYELTLAVPFSKE